MKINKEKTKTRFTQHRKEAAKGGKINSFATRAKKGKRKLWDQAKYHLYRML